MTIGFVGLGRMGGNMAARFLEAGYTVETARELRVDVPSARAADGVLKAALDLGYGRRDIAALFEVLGRLSTGARSPA
jgi:3-hydroxyisobutyrate dehydrogenase-like beta-hydroxyacid dehydrogenase